ncbi:alanine-tRNA synthetase second additional domain-containing protein [uncultured Alistipes sp.]|jgi:hypothetical protein|uniref:alanine-tRNA synthetase second additional domain-containing protein n=1 Tax=uncultured Alistipes sp. TaxID=538949 RepID=UPI0025F8D693|nr:alanine-tRNA synthetase second additional domain-containing protein [uncultured Alistipes sp.]
MRNLIQEYSVFSQYFAPHGRERLLFLGEQIAHRHLTFTDKLIGIVGDAGSGKSSLIRGMFPGLELSNDDDMVNPRKIMQVRNLFDMAQEATTYHIDMRFQMAFTQMCEIVDFVKEALKNHRRVIIEHFQLLYPYLGRNADILIGIGEEIIVTRPSIFGPLPAGIYDIVSKSLQYRKMAHSAEDITIKLLTSEFGISDDLFFSADMRNGFVLKFIKKVKLDIPQLTRRVKEEIAKELDISYVDEDHILIGGDRIECNGPRLHVANSREIGRFTFVKEFVRDPKTKTYGLVGLLLGDDEEIDIENLNMTHFLKRQD